MLKINGLICVYLGLVLFYQGFLWCGRGGGWGFNMVWRVVLWGR
ncbi:hypothetical protein [Alysiella crassa]|nr:hypothetical protein [Alysiella crassa]